MPLAIANRTRSGRDSMPSFSQQLRAVDLDRPDAEEELLADLAVGVAERQQPQQFALALAQVLQRVGLELGQRAAELGVDVGAAAGGGSDRLGQLALGRLLEHVAGGAGAEQVARLARVALHRQDDDRGGGSALAQALDVSRGLGSGHLQVEHQHVGPAISDQLGGGRRVVGLADHPQVGLPLEHAAQAGADHVVIVGQDHRYLPLVSIAATSTPVCHARPGGDPHAECGFGPMAEGRASGSLQA